MASPAIAIRMVRSDARKRLLSRMRDAFEEIKAAMNEQVSKAAIAYAETIVENWNHKPKFVATLYVEDDKISLFIEPTGPNAKYWDWTSRGTKPHIIMAGTRVVGGVKNKLIFQSNYTPKTTPGPTWGGPGKSSGGWVAARYVRHPGTEPRKFEEWIGKQIKTDFRREIEAAFRRGLNKAG